MDQVDEMSYFNRLPNEVLTQILKHLRTIDVISFCDTYPEFEYFLGEKVIISNINLSKKSGFKRLPIMTPILDRVTCEYVTIFNITNVHWIAAINVRNCLKKLKNLEELYILGTKVGCAPADCQSYGSSKLRKLAVSIEDKDLKPILIQYIPNIQSLCLEIISKADKAIQLKLRGLLSKLKLLKELWIHDMTTIFPLNYTEMVYKGKNIEILAYRGLCYAFDDLQYMRFHRVFLSNRSVREAYYVKSNRYPAESKIPKNSGWQVMRELRAEPPYGFHDAKKLVHKNIDEIFFEELNFMHCANTCCPRYISAVKDILSSQNVVELKGLTLTNCLFFNKRLEVCGEDSTNKKKKLNYAEPFTDEQKIIIEHLKNLKKLEIRVCSKHEGFQVYYFIQHMTKLTYLSVEVPGTLNGEFLKLAFENCPLLKSLKIHLVTSNESFNRDFCKYICMAQNLKHLWYEHYRISMENLFLELSTMKSSCLESFFLKCVQMDNFGTTNFTRFLENNRDLEFILITIKTATARNLRELSDKMKIFKDTPDKVYVARKDENMCSAPFPSPEYFISQYISPHSRIATLKIGKEFYKSDLSFSSSSRSIDTEEYE